MSSCPRCKATGAEIEYDQGQGSSVCTRCGTVLEENTVVSELTFNELANGSSVLEGQFISAQRGKANLPTIFGRRAGELRGNGEESSLESREITLANGKRRLQALAIAVGINGDHLVDTAHRWYGLALQHQFTRGRKGPSVLAACLYIVCRQERTPHMLLDFADVLSLSVYQLGGTFLRLVRLLNLEMPLVDPSFYIGRFAARLEFGERTAQVANTALRLAARMKRDWILTGRRPAGVCAAALIIAARMHGFRRTETQVVRIVRICEATLRKRLEEFGKTASSQLSPLEFEGIWLEQESDPPSFAHIRAQPQEGTLQILPAALAIERARQARQVRLALETIAETEEEDVLTPPPSQLEVEQSQSLSDVEVDEEMESMLLTAEEISLKTSLWTELNRDYLEREAEKERLRLALEALPSAVDNDQENENDGKKEKEGYEENIAEGFAAPFVGGPPRKERKKRTAPTETTRKRKLPEAATPAEATKQLLDSKKLSKKFNYDALEQLFAMSASEKQ